VPIFCFNTMSSPKILCLRIGNLAIFHEALSMVSGVKAISIYPVYVSSFGPYSSF
jgi:hypothetical protein